MNNVQVAVAGAGHWGRNLIRNFGELGSLAAVVDPDAGLAAKHAAPFGAKVLSFADACADDAINAIVIAAPAELHAKLALQAFASGKHVYVEKPIALSMVDGEAMRAASKAAGKILMVGHLLQYHPAFIRLRAMVEAGELGALRYAYSNRLSMGKFRLEENALWSLAPHDLSMLLSLFKDKPTEVIGRAGAYITPGIADEYHVDLTFASGARAHIFASWLHPFKEQKLVVVGEKAMAVFEDSEPNKHQKLKLYRHSVDTTSRVPEPVKSDVEFVAYDTTAEPLNEECRHFLACCESGAAPRTDADEALAVLEVLVAAG
jgi:predicted dehydrogenase